MKEFIENLINEAEEWGASGMSCTTEINDYVVRIAIRKKGVEIDDEGDM